MIAAGGVERMRSSGPSVERTKSMSRLSLEAAQVVSFSAAAGSAIGGGFLSQSRPGVKPNTAHATARYHTGGSSGRDRTDHALTSEPSPIDSLTPAQVFGCIG